MKRLLVVDDELEFGEIVRRVAVELGYDVRVVDSGRALQDSYADFQPTTILLDMVIPDFDGNELLLWLLQQGYTADLIITTGFSPDYASNAKRLAEFKGLRSVTTLTKPASLAQLRAVLGKG
jgi:DNA-binding response OmpR family regulator